MHEQNLSVLVREWFPDLPDYRAPQTKPETECKRGHTYPQGTRCPQCHALRERNRVARQKENNDV